MHLPTRTLSTQSLAKINLFLAITSVREDGFHNLLSLVAPVSFGDTLTLETQETGSEDSLECTDSDIPTDERNLVLKAAAAFRKTVAPTGSFSFHLNKRIPVGAGLGGGSSNAAAALQLMNEACDSPLKSESLIELAAGIGSDCPLFLKSQPQIMRGRGEILENISEEALEVLQNQRVWIFKPPFSISTAWAYKTLKSKHANAYISESEAKTKLEKWLKAPGNSFPFFNNLEQVAFNKFIALPTMLQSLNIKFSLNCLMSGSGSACFCVPPPNLDAEKVRDFVIQGWGNNSSFIETQIHSHSTPHL